MNPLRLAIRDQREFINALVAQLGHFQYPAEVVPVTIQQAEHIALGLNQEPFDLLLASTDWIAPAAAKSTLCPLNHYLVTDPPAGWPDAVHPALHKLNGYQNSTYGIPYHDGPQVLHYRDDLFNDPRHQAEFQAKHQRPLAPPKTWQEFAEIATFFTHPERGEWGCCFAGYPDGHSNVYDFLLHLWGRQGTLIDDQNQPCFHHPPGIEALTFLRDLVHNHKVAHPESPNLNSIQSGDLYAQGKIALMWNWSGYALVTENPEVSKIVGLSKTAPLPSNVSINAYWIMAILTCSHQKDRAYKLVKHLATSAMDKLAAQNGISAVRLETWQDPEIRSRFPVYRLLSQVHDHSRTLPQHPRYQEINAALNQAIDDALNLRQSPQSALKIAADQIRTILQP